MPVDTVTRHPAKSYAFSKAASDLLKLVEALSLKPYDDQTRQGISGWVPGATIGYGHLITKEQWANYANGFAQDQAEALLVHDLAPSMTAVQNTILAPVSQNEFDAMIILTFNIGATGFASSSVAKLINDPQARTAYADLEGAWKSWDKSQGKVMAGLDKRRQAEWNIYASGIYKQW